MFKNLKLTNFRQHTAKEIDFQAGLVVLKGANEAGKSGIIEALSYALFGSSALRTPLEDVVTYGKPINTLKVELVFVVDEVEYTISRGKSGADISYAGGTVTGQVETRTFIERLLGLTAKMSSHLLFATQTDIRGVLTQGPTAAAALIQALANLGELEVIIEKIQTQLPCGNTILISGQLAEAKAILSDEVVVLEPDDTLLLEARAEQRAAAASLLEAKAAYASASDTANKAIAAVATQKKAVEHNLWVAKAQAAAAAEVLPKLPELEGAEIDLMIAKEEGRRNWAALYSSSKKQFPVVTQYWSGTRDEFFTEREELKLELSTLANARRVAEVRLTKLTAQLITEKSCAFCKKDLSEVAEVAVFNASLSPSIAALKVEMVKLETREAEVEQALAVMREMEILDRKISGLIDGFWDRAETMPVTPTWKHGDVDQEPETLQPKIDTAIAEWKFYEKEMARIEAAVKQAKTLEMQDASHYDWWEQALEAKTSAATAATCAAEAERKTSMAVAHAEGDYQIATNMYRVYLRDIESAKQRIEKLGKDLIELTSNNELVKKIRTAGPIIANKLWATVLGAVSYYFSNTRGVESAVTKTPDGFKVDGQNVQGLSGSTLDALGLALRLALVKTFIPNAGFIVLDEPASGCDEQRELAMLGTVASAGFDQTLLVTHSDLADSFAAEVVQL